MTETDIAWAAGFFDGEGTVFVCHNKHVPHRDRKNPTLYNVTTPCISISQVIPEPLFRFSKIVAGRKPGGPYYPKNKKHKSYYRWDAQGRPSVHRILTLLWPYLSLPKKLQAVETWEELKRCAGKKSPKLPELPDLGTENNTYFFHVTNWKPINGGYKPWTGFDLDGTLSHFDFDRWITEGDSYIGDPIPEMINLVKEYLKLGHTVKIFTARISKNKINNTKIIQNWLESVGLPRLEVTNQKDYGMVLLYDDRVTEVVFNTGRFKYEQKTSEESRQTVPEKS